MDIQDMYESDIARMELLLEKQEVETELVIADKIAEIDRLKKALAAIKEQAEYVLRTQPYDLQSHGFDAAFRYIVEQCEETK